MKITKIFDRDDWKRSKKIKALHKVLDKLKKKRAKIEHDLKSENSKKKIKKLEIKLKTNKRHRHKAEKLIKELQ
jgi:predicted  nucleic acid-binding Zn-ribbon protein